LDDGHCKKEEDEEEEEEEEDLSVRKALSSTNKFIRILNLSIPWILYINALNAHS
jgi:hypothetical protein